MMDLIQLGQLVEFIGGVVVLMTARHWRGLK